MNTTGTKIDILIAFEKANQVNGGFETSELANEYIRLRLEAFPNEVFVGSLEKDGVIIPGFNVFN